MIGACYPKGFKAAGVAAGIKTNGNKDLSVLVSESPAVAAGVFTKNLVKAAPVVLSIENLSKSASASAIVFSSGNANAATGEQGMQVAKSMCAACAEKLSVPESQVLIAQTGLIGIPLDEKTAVSGVSKAMAELSADAGKEAAEAMMTTDTVPKLFGTDVEVSGKTIKVGGMAKGAAMLAPSMATMLGVVTTDANLSAETAKQILSEAMEESFHSMVVDGCTSTNDTVFLLANGESGASEINGKDSPGYKEVASAVTAACKDLAKQMAKDGEGATKFLTMKVEGAASSSDAKLASKAVVSSLLVKCSLAGEGQYWGRVIAELGASGASFDPNEVDIYYGSHLVCKGGLEHAHDELAVANLMKEKDITITAKLAAGNSSWEAYGCDLTHAYVDENMGNS